MYSTEFQGCIITGMRCCAPVLPVLQQYSNGYSRMPSVQCGTNCYTGSRAWWHESLPTLCGHDPRQWNPRPGAGHPRHFERFRIRTGHPSRRGAACHHERAACIQGGFSLQKVGLAACWIVIGQCTSERSVLSSLRFVGSSIVRHRFDQRCGYPSGLLQQTRLSRHH